MSTPAKFVAGFGGSQKEQLQTTVTLIAGVGLVALAGWAIYNVFKLLNAAKTGVTAVGDAVAGGIANAYVAATSGPPVETTFSFVLPNGTQIPGDQVRIIDPNIPTFSYQGAKYKVLSPRRADNNYDAVPL